MANMDREPFWGYKKTYSLKDKQDLRNIRFEACGKPRSEVTPCDGTFDLEYLYLLTLPQFEMSYKEQQWPAANAYTQFGKRLSGDMKVAWDKMLDKHFSDIDLRDHDN